MFLKLETILLTKISLDCIKTIIQIQEKYKIIKGKSSSAIFEVLGNC